MKKTIRKLAVVASGLVLGLGLGAGSASALPVVQFTLVPTGAAANPLSPGVAVGTFTYQLWEDPSAVPGGAFGIGDTAVYAAGSLRFNSGAGVFPGTIINLSQAGGALPNCPNVPGATGTSCTLFGFTSGDVSLGNTAPFEIATLVLTNSGSGLGDITLFSGDYLLSDGFTQQNVSPLPQTLAIAAATIPEPGTLLLLGVGMGGMAVLIGRSRHKS